MASIQCSGLDTELILSAVDSIQGESLGDMTHLRTIFSARALNSMTGIPQDIPAVPSGAEHAKRMGGFPGLYGLDESK